MYWINQCHGFIRKLSKSISVEYSNNNWRILMNQKLYIISIILKLSHMCTQTILPMPPTLISAATLLRSVAWNRHRRFHGCNYFSLLGVPPLSCTGVTAPNRCHYFDWHSVAFKSRTYWLAKYKCDYCYVLIQKMLSVFHLEGV